MQEMIEKKYNTGYLKAVLRCMGGAGYIIASFVCNVTEGVINTALAVLGGSLLDSICAKDKPGMNNILIVSMILAAVLFISISIKDYFIGTYLENGMVKLKHKTIQQLNYAKLSWLDKMHTGELSSRITGDLNSLTGALRPVLIIGVSWTFAQLISLIYMFYADLKLSLIVFAFVPVILISQWFLSRRIRHYRLKNLEAVGDMTAVASDFFGAHETVKALALEKDMLSRFGTAQKKQVSSAKKEILIDSCLGPLSLMCEWLPRITLLVAGGRGVLEGDMSIGHLMTFIALSYRTIRALGILPDSFAAIRRLSASCVRIAQLWEVPKERDTGVFSDSCATGAIGSSAMAADATAADIAPDVQKESLLSLENVRFSYDPCKIEDSGLKDISFDLDSGDFVALVGESGCGKSTVLKLIASLYEPTGGVIRFMGSDISRWKLESLRGKIAYVTQETFLFSGSVRDNITCCKDNICNEDIRTAIAAAGLADFIDSLPNGSDTQIGERGIFLSGGQRQRISIARAILTRPELLLLDEATSALDKRTECEVVSSLLSLPCKPAVILAAHRLATVRDASRIYVIDKGCIAEYGTHEQLKAAGGVYSGMLSSSVFSDEVSYVS